jgi:single-strand DNA-binding protein
MSSLNKVTLIGRVGKDPEINTTKAGKKIASFSLATSEHWKDKQGQRQEKTEWHQIVIYNENIAKVVESYVNKGSHICIEGALQTRKWQDKDGKDRYTTEIILQDFKGQLILLGSKSDDAQPEMQGNVQAKSSYASAELDDTIPF